MTATSSSFLQGTSVPREARLAEGGDSVEEDSEEAIDPGLLSLFISCKYISSQ